MRMLWVRVLQHEKVREMVIVTFQFGVFDFMSFFDFALRRAGVTRRKTSGGYVFTKGNKKLHYRQSDGRVYRTSSMARSYRAKPRYRIYDRY